MAAYAHGPVNHAAHPGHQITRGIKQCPITVLRPARVGPRRIRNRPRARTRVRGRRRDSTPARRSSVTGVGMSTLGGG
jgi:hypothetical protein